MTSYRIEVLKSTECVRRRPGMYFGDVATDAAMHAMLDELLGNSIDEHLRRGTGGYIRIAFAGYRVSVEDDGRGIPIDALADGRTALETILTELHPGTAASPHVHVRPDLAGVGVAAVCALAAELEAEVWRDGKAHVQRFARGAAVGPIEERGPTTRTGTRISFTPDFTVLALAPWDVERVARKGRAFAALIPGLTVIVDDEAYCYPDGMRDHLRYLACGEQLVEPLYVRATHADVHIELALAWVDRRAAEIHSFVNCSPTRDGTHVAGMLAGINRVFAKLLKTRRRTLKAQLARGLLAIVHVDLECPRFGSPTREWLDNAEVGEAVRTVVERELAAHLARTPALLDWVLVQTEDQSVSSRRPAVSA
jgi:DNA gyrase subunit B